MKSLSTKYLILGTVILNLGCSTSSKNSVPSEKAKPVALSAPSSTMQAGLVSGDYLSFARRDRVSAESCPANANSWRGENLKNIISYASNCVQLGQFERVEQLGQFLAQKHYQLPWGPYFLSLAAESRKDYKRGIWMIELAIKRDTNQALMYYQKGRLHWALNEFSVAVPAFQTAVEKNSQFLDAHIFLGQMFYRDQNAKQAVYHFEKARSIQGQNIDATLGLAESQISLGQSAAAVKLYEELVAMAPSRLAYRYKLANLYETVAKDDAQALAAYKRIREMSLQVRKPAEEIPADINERIQRLESKLAAQAKVVSQDADSSKLNVNKKVKK